MNKKIVFIGSGNVATHLSQVLKSAGHEVLQVYSRNKNNARKLAKKFHCGFTDNFKKIKKGADIYFVCVKDDAIEKIISDLRFSDSPIIVHTSGSASINIFKRQKNCGVFYPMQTFSKQKKVDLSNTAIFIEANTKHNENILMNLAKSISKNIYRMNSEQRKTVHLAAVFANNFTNHFYNIAEEILKKKNLSFEILKSLILETAEKVQKQSPSTMQTGPAKRGDKKIISEHLKMLKEFSEYKKIYALVSASIMKKHQ